jgi:hypothetical protein
MSTICIHVYICIYIYIYITYIYIYIDIYTYIYTYIYINIYLVVCAPFLLLNNSLPPHILHGIPLKSVKIPLLLDPGLRKVYPLQNLYIYIYIYTLICILINKSTLIYTKTSIQ